MTISSVLRVQVRALYKYRCAYCGVSETEIGGELEIDHFHPSIHGGSDDVTNLLAVCTTCNRFSRSMYIYSTLVVTIWQTMSLNHQMVNLRDLRQEVGFIFTGYT